jgi:Rieske Fe-S protein
MAEPARSRRSALEALILSALGGAGLWRFLTPLRRRAARRAAVVPAADVPHQGALVLPRERCAVVRTPQGVRAFDLTCPHLGCTVRADSAGFACPCHGSRFRSDGTVARGPAPSPLKSLAIEQHGDAISVLRDDDEEP